MYTTEATLCCYNIYTRIIATTPIDIIDRTLIIVIR